MRTYLINTIGQIPSTNRELDYKSTLKTNEWVVFNDNQGDVEKFLFLDSDKLLISLNGKTSYSKWQYMKVNSSLVIDDGDNKYMFKIIVCNKDIVLLNVDSTDNYSFLINTKSEALENCTYKEIQWYLKKICGVDIFNNEQKNEYEDAQRKLEQKREKERQDIQKRRLKRIGIVSAIILGIIIIFIICVAISSMVYEKDEYKRTHPIMSITRIDNRRAVDLGLSVKWATCNIGANKPDELGNRYGWGDTTGIIYEGKHNGEPVLCISGDLYAYPTRKKEKAPRSIIATQYDVARMSWGKDWRMPTLAEVQELIDNCSFIVEENYIQAIGPNGNYIIFPYSSSINSLEYATGELDTTPNFVENNKSIYSFRLGIETNGNGCPYFNEGRLVPHVATGTALREDMLLVRAVKEN